MRRLTRFVAALAACLLLSACGSSSSALLVRYDLVVQPRSLDPQLAVTGESLMVLENVFEGLLRQGPDGSLVPGAAERYEVSKDGLTYTFHLREDLLWSDGKTPLTAQDFVFAFRRVVDPATAAPSATGFLCIQNAAQILDGLMPTSALGAEAVDDRTFVVRLAVANPFFPQLAASAAALPCNEAFFTEQRGRYGYSEEYLLENGPFAIKRVVQDKRMELRPNPHYRSESGTQAAGVNIYYQTDDKPDAEQPDKVLQTAQEKVRERFLTGETHAVAATATEAEQYLAALPGAQAASFQNRVWGLAFNCAQPMLASDKLRRALALALDTAAFSPYLTGSLSPADAIVPSAVSLQGMPYRETAGALTFPARAPEAARALYLEALAELGLEKAPRTSILCPQDGNFSVMLGAYQKQLQQAFGIYVNLEPLSEAELLERVALGDFTLAFVPLTAERNTPDSVLEPFASYSSRNVCGYTSAAFDALLARAQAAAAPAAAASAYRAAEQLLVDDAVFLPIAYETTYYVSAPGIMGLQFSPFSYRVFFQHAEEMKK